MKMYSLPLCKIIRDTRLWKKGQKVWVLSWRQLGHGSSPALGRYKGTGRWINAWIHYDSDNKHADAKWIGEVKVSQEFILYLSQFERSAISYIDKRLFLEEYIFD